MRAIANGKYQLVLPLLMVLLLAAVAAAVLMVAKAAVVVVITHEMALLSHLGKF
jgi:hypothetical protein